MTLTISLTIVGSMHMFKCNVRLHTLVVLLAGPPATLSNNRRSRSMLFATLGGWWFLFFVCNRIVAPKTVGLYYKGQCFVSCGDALERDTCSLCVSEYLLGTEGLETQAVG